VIFLQYFNAAAYGPAVATASQTPSSLATFKFRLVFTFLVLAYPGCPETGR